MTLEEREVMRESLKARYEDLIRLLRHDQNYVAHETWLREEGERTSRYPHASLHESLAYVGILTVINQCLRDSI